RAPGGGPLERGGGPPAGAPDGLGDGPRRHEVDATLTGASSGADRPRRFSRLARTKSAHRGCGESGLLLNSGWNCTAMNHGWSGISAISTNLPSGVLPEMAMPPWVRKLSYCLLN